MEFQASISDGSDDADAQVKKTCNVPMKESVCSKYVLLEGCKMVSRHVHMVCNSGFAVATVQGFKVQLKPRNR